MIFVYTKDRKPKKVFDINLTQEEVAKYMDNNLFMDYPNLTPSDYVVYESDIEPQYPVYDADSDSIVVSRETTIIVYGVTDLLKDGELVQDGKIVTVEAPKELIRPKWNGAEWIESYTQAEMNIEIDIIKQEILNAGFLWRNQHEQKCRDKDIARLNNAISSINYAYIKEEDKKLLWRFNDEDKVVLTLVDLMGLQASMFGFIQNVNDAEDEMKTGALKRYNKEEFLRVIERLGGIQ